MWKIYSFFTSFICFLSLKMVLNTYCHWIWRWNWLNHIFWPKKKQSKVFTWIKKIRIWNLTIEFNKVFFFLFVWDFFLQLFYLFCVRMFLNNVIQTKKLLFVYMNHGLCVSIRVYESLFFKIKKNKIKKDTNKIKHVILVKFT